MSQEMIKCENIIFKYTSHEDGIERYAINGVDLTVKKGEFLVDAGHDGSGKSTLAKHTNALLLPTAGND